MCPRFRGKSRVYIEHRVVHAALRAGLDERTLEDVQLKLRTAGIPILTLQQALFAMLATTKTNLPTLDLGVNTTKGQSGEVDAYSIRLEVMQWVTLRSGERADATTWSVQAVGRGNLQDIRGEVGDMVDQFVNAWRAANPR
jgi:hypothetical protein